MRVQQKESMIVSGLILPRREFLKGLVGLVAAPAVVKAELLMPVKVWRPPLIWRNGMIACNGVELAVADFPDLFAIFGYMHGGWGPKFRLHDHALAVSKHLADTMWYIAPRVFEEWPFVRQVFHAPSQSPDLLPYPSSDEIAKYGALHRTETISSDLRARLDANRAKYAR
jgi:hypothetical protein